MSSEPARRRALLALLFLAPVPSLGVAAAVFLAPGPVGRFLWAATKVVLVLFPLLWHLLVDREPVSLSPARRGGFGAGLATGVAAAAVILGVWYLFLRSRVDPAGLAAVAVENGFASKGRYLLAAAWITFGNSLAEEYVFRWFLISRARRLVPGAAAVLLAAAIFTAHHVVVLRAYVAWPSVLLGSAGVFAIGVVWGILYLRARSVWPPWLSHVLADAAVVWIGYDLLFRIARL